MIFTGPLGRMTRGMLDKWKRKKKARTRPAASALSHVPGLSAAQMGLHD